MPLVASLNVQQFVGILAHEFGHFSQRSGMRLSFVIRSINDWFYRVANQRDSWDEWLIDAVEDENGHWTINSLFLFAMMCVGLSRFILRLFLLLSQVISCFLLRQMEYSADTFEIRFCGSQNFKTTEHRLEQIFEAYRSVLMDVVTVIEQKKVNRDIPASLARRMSSVRSTGVIQERVTGLFDTHPSNSSRIKRAERIDDEGIFEDTRVASELFFGFEELCKKVTEDFYRVNLGMVVGKKKKGRHEKDWMVE